MEEEILQLKRPYPTIKGSYGGDQGWFHDDVYSHGDLIGYGGCGLIAMSDLLLYLEGQTESQRGLPSLVRPKELTPATYQLFVESLYYCYLHPWRNPFFNPSRTQREGSFVLGIQGWQLKRGVNRYFKTNKSYFYSNKRKIKLSRLIQKQLQKNYPIPLMIGPTKAMFPKLLRYLGRNQGVEARHLTSKKEEDQWTTISAHWVTVTGYYQRLGREYVLVSSWGARYELDLTAYLAEKDCLGGVLVIK